MVSPRNIQGIRIPYLEHSDGITDREVEILLEVDGIRISVFVPRSRVNFDDKTIFVVEVGRAGDSVFIDLPGEPLNTPKRLEVNSGWLQGVMAD